MIMPVPPARHLLRAKDLIDARYREQLDVSALARAARLSQAHFSREFRRSFGETPHQRSNAKIDVEPILALARRAISR
jgi:AraC-like DNA-binding protein